VDKIPVRFLNQTMISKGQKIDIDLLEIIGKKIYLVRSFVNP